MVPAMDRGSDPFLQTVWPPRLLLVPVDFSPPALEACAVAVRMASDWGARVILLHVLEPVAEDPDVVLHLDEFEAARREQGWERLRRLGERLGGGVEAVLGSGSASEAVMECSRERGVELVVMARRGWGAGKADWLGGLAERLAGSAPCPVWVRPSSDAGTDCPGRVMLGTDLSSHAAEGMPTALALAGAGEPLTVVHVREPMGLPGTQEYERHRVEIDALRREAETEAGAWAERHGQGRPVTVRVVEGTPYRALIRCAERMKAGMLVVTRHGGGGWWKGLIGSTAERVVRHAPCTVLVIPVRVEEDAPE